MWSLWASPKVTTITSDNNTRLFLFRTISQMGRVKCDYIKRLIIFTNDNDKRLSLHMYINLRLTFTICQDVREVWDSVIFQITFYIARFILLRFFKIINRKDKKWRNKLFSFWMNMFLPFSWCGTPVTAIASDFLNKFTFHAVTNQKCSDQTIINE